jgi:hypothetical protein
VVPTLRLKKATEPKKPLLIFDMETDTDVGSIVKWIRDIDIKVLNVADLRESFMLGVVYRLLKEILTRVFSKFKIRVSQNSLIVHSKFKKTEYLFQMILQNPPYDYHSIISSCSHPELFLNIRI